MRVERKQRAAGEDEKNEGSPLSVTVFFIFWIGSVTVLGNKREIPTSSKS